MRKNWPDAKVFIFEDICVNSFFIAFNLVSDFILNLLRHIGIGNPHEVAHPYSLGLFQFLFLGFCVIQLIRSLNRWKFYGRLPTLKLE